MNLFGRSGYSLVAALVLVSGTAFSDPEMTAHFIDVRQGAAALLEFPCGAVLIDAGGPDAAAKTVVADYLRAFFNRRTDLNKTLELVIITHNHIDHNVGLRKVFEEFTVKRYIDNGWESGKGKPNAVWVHNQIDNGDYPADRRVVLDSEITALSNLNGLTNSFIDPIKCADCDPKITILSGDIEDNPGWSKKAFENQNNHSLVVKVEFGQSSFLFTGDLEFDGIETMLDWYHQSGTLDVDVYHAGHHGADNGTTHGLLKEMTPGIAVISCGHWDDGRGSQNKFTTHAYGHPRLTVIDRLADYVSEDRTPTTQKVAGGVRSFADHTISKAIYCTAWDGTVKIRGFLNAEPAVVD